jgi:hypothetical protein
MHLPSLNPRQKSEKSTSTLYSFGHLERTSKPRSLSMSPNTTSVWQSPKVSHWAIHKLVMDSWFLTSNPGVTVNLTCSHASVRNFSWETGWHCLSLSFSICTHAKDHRNQYKSARNNFTSNGLWNSHSMPAIHTSSPTQHDTVSYG